MASEACTPGNGVGFTPFLRLPNETDGIVMLLEGALSIAVAIAAYFLLPNWGT